MHSVVLLESGAVGRVLGVSAERVRQLADSGLLPVSMRTRRGVRLFRRADVERVRRQRASRREQAPVAP